MAYLYDMAGSDVYHVFVYGSLRRGFHSHAYEYISRFFDFVGEGKVKGKLYDLGSYPAATPALEEAFIKGEYANVDKDGKIKFEVTKNGDTAVYEFEVSAKPVSKQNSPANGMLEVESKQTGDKFYIHTGELGFGLPFGLGGGELYRIENNKLVKFTSVELTLVKNNLNKERENKGLPTFEQLSSQLFFSTVERVFTEFQGLSYLPTLFMDQDSLLKWREDIDRVFATAYLGTEYWSSAICGQYLDGEDEGIAWGETPQGLAQVAAHIEATRSEAIITPTGTEFIYKITFNVRNGDYEKDRRAPEQMNINVVLKGERTVNLFRQDQSVKRGSSFGRTGRNAIAKSSTSFYNEICLTFDKVPFRWKVSNNEICNTIVGSSGAATTISASTATSTTSSGGTGGGDGEFNEI